MCTDPEKILFGSLQVAASTSMDYRTWSDKLTHKNKVSEQIKFCFTRKRINLGCVR